MKILVIEDNEKKYSEIVDILNTEFGTVDFEIVRAETLRIATREIYEHKYDLIIIDLMMPLRENRLPEDISEEIIPILTESEKNNTTRAIAFTGFNELLDSRSRSFNENLIPLIRYEANSDGWKFSLSRELKAISNASLFEFVVICALRKELQAFEYTDATLGEHKIIRGLDCLDINIGGKRGVLVLQPRMGMTDAGIITTLAISAFQPKYVAMSGICAGIPDRSKIGDILAIETCFDYQVGKWSEKNGFEFEQYQTSISEKVRGIISQLISIDEHGKVFREGLGETDLNSRKVKLVTNATGSAVVADAEQRNEIAKQHRKLASVEMEIYSVFRAAKLSPVKPDFFAVKGVVDDAGASKGDRYHSYGATVAARFIVRCFEKLFE